MNPRSRLLLGVVLLGVWLLLWGSAALGVVLLGVVVALLLPRLTMPFWPHYPPVYSYRALVVLLGLFAVDVVVANLVVATRILGPQARLRPCFVVVPLNIEQPLVTALFANMISLTPGTVACNISGDGKSLLVHALDCDDPQALAAAVKQRYERRLQEVFAC